MVPGESPPQPRPDSDAALARICQELVSVYRMHTVLLYGSRADGSATADSDYDIAAFGPIDAPLRIARPQDGAYLDIWAYPEAMLGEATEEFLRLQGSTIVLQRGQDAQVFLSRVDEIYRRGPPPLSANELAARRVWAHKMLARVERADPEGNYRRVWLLYALLEDYFQSRGLWSQGPKKSLRWLERFDLPVYQAYCLALQPGADHASIAALVHLLAGPSADLSASSAAPPP
jgi:hypothetical protein